MAKPGRQPLPEPPADPWREQLRRGGLELAILLTLSHGSRYGLEIIRHLEAFTDLVVTEGTIYPILGRLHRDGLLEAEWRDAGHARKYYKLTRQGRTRLREMIDIWQAFSDKLGRLVTAAEGDAS